MVAEFKFFRIPSTSTKQPLAAMRQVAVFFEFTSFSSILSHTSFRSFLRSSDILDELKLLLKKGLPRDRLLF